jgi:lycopene cyclase domain-containing protein
MKNLLYLMVDLLSVSLPLMFSFYPKANFSKKYRFLWPSILISAALFLCWDIAFTRMGVWGFNPDYVSGIYVFNLPMEEVLFFICIPYCCVYLYEAMKYFIVRDYLKKISPFISVALIVLLAVIVIVHFPRWYTSIALTACAGLIAFNIRSSYMGRFYFSYALVLVPFMIVNGILTGSFTEEPVVWYNEKEIIGIRIGTIPIEDVFYGMLLMLSQITMYENFQVKFPAQSLRRNAHDLSH